MRKLVPFISAIFALSIVSALSAAEFSAKYTEKRGPANIKGTQYVKGKNIRQVTTLEGTKQIIIIRPDKKVTWQLYPNDKTYIEYPYANGDLSQQISQRAKRLAEVSKVGKETVNQMVCDKYTFKYKMEGAGVGTQWVSQKLGWPIKTEIKAKTGDILVELTGIKVEKQPDKLFEIPKDYKKINTPSLESPKPAKNK